MTEFAANLAPFVRILLWALAGYLAGQGADSWLVVFIQSDPGLLAAVVSILTGLWYALAKKKGWKT